MVQFEAGYNNEGTLKFCDFMSCAADEFLMAQLR
jgi:hypothetical protein